MSARSKQQMLQTFAKFAKSADQPVCIKPKVMQNVQSGYLKQISSILSE